MQRHFLRNEFWIVLKGSGRAWVSEGGWKDRDMFSTYYIKKEAWHEFRALAPTLALELQWGSACKEADIERID